MGHSNELVHEPLIKQADFDRVQEMLSRRARTATAPKRTNRSRHPYIFKSLVHCGICGRKMQGQHGVAYYRCRFPQEYALANKADRPRNVIMREDVLIKPLDTWLVQGFGPLQQRHTIAALLNQAHADMPTVTPVASEGPTVAQCDAKLARYRPHSKPAPTRPWSLAGSPKPRPNATAPNNTSALRSKRKPTFLLA